MRDLNERCTGQLERDGEGSDPLATGKCSGGRFTAHGSIRRGLDRGFEPAPTGRLHAVQERRGFSSTQTNVVARGVCGGEGFGERGETKNPAAAELRWCCYDR